MSGFGKWLKDQVFEDGENQSNQDVKIPIRTPTNQPSVLQPSIASNTVYLSSPSAVPGSEDLATNMLAKMKDVLRKNNVAGPDYYEFQIALQNSAFATMIEAQKFQAVFAGLAAVGLTKAALLSSIETYFRALDDKKAKIDEKAKEHLEEITSKNQSVINSNNTLIQEKTTAIDALKNEIQALSQQNSAANLEISTEAQQTQSLQGAFVTAYNAIRTTMDSDKQKISSFII
jgi:hypothetical protein